MPRSTRMIRPGRGMSPMVARAFVELGQRAGRLDPGRAAADDDHVERVVERPRRRRRLPRPAPGGAAAAVRRRRPSRAGRRARRHRARRSTAAVAAGRDDQVRPCDDRRRRRASRVRAAGSIAGHLGRCGPRPSGSREDRPVRSGDVLGRQLRGGHLVEQRLELVVVVAVDKVTRTPSSPSAWAQATPASPPPTTTTWGAPVLHGHSDSSSRRSDRMIRPAASISARWENACGKLPRCRARSTSNSSA